MKDNMIEDKGIRKQSALEAPNHSLKYQVHKHYIVTQKKVSKCVQDIRPLFPGAWM